MSTIQDLVDRIKNEVAGAAFESQVVAAVADAVGHYSAEPWWFLEGEASVDTVAETATVALPADYETIKLATVTVGGVREFVHPKPYDWYVDRLRATTASGQPYYFSVFGELCHLWPTPDQIYPVTFSYIKSLSAAITADNEWSATAAQLIKYRAKWDLYLNVNRDFEEAGLQKQAEIEAYARLRRRSRNRRAAPDEVRMYA